VQQMVKRTPHPTRFITSGAMQSIRGTTSYSMSESFRGWGVDEGEKRNEDRGEENMYREEGQRTRLTTAATSSTSGSNTPHEASCCGTRQDVCG